MWGALGKKNKKYVLGKKVKRGKEKLRNITIKYYRKGLKNVSLVFLGGMDYLAVACNFVSPALAFFPTCFEKLIQRRESSSCFGSGSNYILTEIFRGIYIFIFKCHHLT